MPPVIRVSDATYKRLENHASGFDTPNNVIDRLLDHMESCGSSSSTSPPSADISNQSSTRTHLSLKKPRNPKKERDLKLAVGKSLNWGSHKLSSASLLIFNNGERRILCKYSSFSTDQNRWFWGVSSKYWSEWKDNDYLALIMENDDLETYSFLLINPNDARKLFTKCSESNGEKKINLRFYKGDGKMHFQEWQDFVVRDKITMLKT